MKQPCLHQIVVVGLLVFCCCSISVRANVYATDVRLNGSFKTGVILPGDTVTISYILNDTATGGVQVRICSGTNVVKTLSSAGTNAGLNSVVWDGSTDAATNAPQGAYSVSITAASTGYDTWTNITDDGTNFSVFEPRGIAVNKNTNSPFYGRVYAGNAYSGGGDAPGNQVGLIKYNADGSLADEGGFSTGGWGWAGDKYSPWKMTVAADDRLYVDDFTDEGIVFSFDPTLAANSRCQVLCTSNYPANDVNPFLSGLTVIGTGTNAEIWMTDENPLGSAGILRWQISSNDMVASNDTGTVIAPINPFCLSQAPYDLALDTNGFIYTIQFISPEDDPAYALIRFPPYTGTQVTMPSWAIEEYPTLLRASGVAVNPAADCVAVAVIGPCDTESACGGLYLFKATNGQFIDNLDQSGGDPYYDVTWDNVGNLYALDGGSNGVWRAYSPPGTNHATTVAVPLVQAYNALVPPSLINPAMTMDSNKLAFTLAGQSNVTYVVQRSSDLTNWTAALTNFSACTNRDICVPACGSQNFYRAVSAP